MGQKHVVQHRAVRVKARELIHVSTCVHVYCAVVLMHDCTRATKMRTIAQCPMLSVSTCAIWVQVPGVVYRRRGVRWGVRWGMRWGVRSLRWGSAIIKRPLSQSPSGACHPARDTSPSAIHLRPAGLKQGSCRARPRRVHARSDCRRSCCWDGRCRAAFPGAPAPERKIPTSGKPPTERLRQLHSRGG